MRRALCVGLLLAAGRLAAQAPVVTPAGDPSVQSDTIYRLALDSADANSPNTVFLLDDGIVRAEADGRIARTYRQIVLVRNREGVERWSEFEFGYEPDEEHQRINWIRVVRPDGSVISDGPSHEQESDVPADQDAPVYTSRRVKRITMAGVAIGTIVDYSFTTETYAPLVPKDWSTGWRITTGIRTRRSRFLLDVPQGMKPRIKEANLPNPRVESTGGGRRVYAWVASDLAPVTSNLFPSDSDGVIGHVDASGPLSWSDIGAWYGGLVKDRFTVGEEVWAAAGREMATATSRLDSLKALHRWVAQDVRYVSIALGIGGYRPRLPGEVVSTGYGDCKDKTTLFIATARRLGFAAFPVLVNSTTSADSALPSVHQFDHMIAAVPLDGRNLYIDLTADLVPFGQVPPSLEGTFGLLLRPDGKSETVRLPETPADSNLDHWRLAGTLDSTGAFHGRFSREVSGRLQYRLRDLFSSALDSTQREAFTRAFAGALYRDATGDSLEVFDGRDLNARTELSLVITADRVTQSGGTTEALPLPMPTLIAAGLVDQLRAERGVRRFPIDVAQVVGPVDIVTEYQVTVPNGWRARLPDGVHADSPFGKYDSEYRQDGTVVTIRRHLRGARGTEPPDRLNTLIDWARQVARDDIRLLLLEHP